MSRQAQPLRSLTAIITLCLVGTIPLRAQEISNPKLYKKSLGAAGEAFRYYGEYDEAAERRRVNDIGYRLAVMSDFKEVPFTFYVIDMPAPNAFALPGGQIFVTSGMLMLGLTDDMLACLLGHELAHVVYKHGSRMQRRAALLNMLSTALLVGVMVGASDEAENPYDPYRSGSRKGSLVQGTAAAGMALSELLLRNYSRDFEDEADVEGQRLAAAAGYDPAGAHQLWQLMNARIPQAKVYGYWRTHPFSDQRMRAAQVRASELKVLTGKPPEDYRAKVQQVLIDYADRSNKDADLEPFIELSALNAWPRGPRAEKIRLTRLHAERDAELEKKSEVQRDYGKLIRAYEAQIEEVRALSPDSAFLATLENDLHALADQAEATFPKALEIWNEGIYQTPFLETFLSNHPDAEQAPEVALVLGNAYSRLGRQTDAVEQFLHASEAGTESEAGRRALAGLRNLAPFLDRLAALQQLIADARDEELRGVARDRLAEMAPKYEDIENGGDYLKRFPDGEQGNAVRERLEALAENLYGEVVLYQGVGDHVKALERIQLILTHAPFSSAAEQLRDQAVFEG